MCGILLSHVSLRTTESTSDQKYQALQEEIRTLKAENAELNKRARIARMQTRKESVRTAVRTAQQAADEQRNHRRAL